MPRTPKTSPKEWLTLAQASSYAKVSPSNVMRAARAGHLSGVKLDPGNPRSKWLFTTEDVDRWLERGRVKAAS